MGMRRSGEQYDEPVRQVTRRELQVIQGPENVSDNDDGGAMAQVLTWRSRKQDRKLLPAA